MILFARVAIGLVYLLRRMRVSLWLCMRIDIFSLFIFLLFLIIIGWVGESTDGMGLLTPWSCRSNGSLELFC